MPTNVAIPAPTAVQEAVSTELTAAKSVTADAPVAAVANNPAQSGPELSRKVLTDAHTNEVIYRLVDLRSRQVVRHILSEARLRARAYKRAIVDGQSPSQTQHQTDLSA